MPGVVVREAEIEAKVIHERNLLYKFEDPIEKSQGFNEKLKTNSERAKKYDQIENKKK